MSARGSTPQGKDTLKNPQSSSKYRTPPNLNSTFLERKDTASRFSGNRTTSRFTRGVSASHLDVTGITSYSRAPTVKSNLTTIATPQVDYELECDFAYSDYLQALLKKEILTKATKKQEEELHDQIAIQRDNLFKTKLKCKEAKQELAELEQLDEVTQLIDILSNNFDEFHTLTENIDLKCTLEQLLCLFNRFCSKVTVKNVKPLETEDFNRLESVLKECVTVLQRLNLQDRNRENVNSLAEVMRKYQEQVEQVTQKQIFINTTQENEVFKLFKSLSQLYAKRENYQLS